MFAGYICVLRLIFLNKFSNQPTSHYSPIESLYRWLSKAYISELQMTSDQGFAIEGFTLCVICTKNLLNPLRALLVIYDALDLFNSQWIEDIGEEGVDVREKGLERVGDALGVLGEEGTLLIVEGGLQGRRGGGVRIIRRGGSGLSGGGLGDGRVPVGDQLFEAKLTCIYWSTWGFFIGDRVI